MATISKLAMGAAEKLVPPVDSRMYRYSDFYDRAVEIRHEYVCKLAAIIDAAEFGELRERAAEQKGVIEKLAADNNALRSENSRLRKRLLDSRDSRGEGYERGD